ncbi:MAG: tetratricopeptide repeat protein [Pseudomonadota bacterium]
MDVAPDQSVTAATAKKLDLAVIGLLVAVLAVFALDRLIPEKPATNDVAAAQSLSPDTESTDETTPATDPRSVAVLPFEGYSASANDYFSDGLTETLLHMLAQVPELKVAARTSSFAYKGKGASIREIATELTVANVLEGSVQRDGDRVRITTKLSRAADGFVIWSEVFDKTMNDVFAIQDEIAKEVSNALAVSLLITDEDSPFATVSTRNIEAYDSYLQALAAYHKATIPSLAEAEALLRKVIVLEPQFAEAQGLLAQVLLWQTDTGARPFYEGMAAVLEAANAALALDGRNVKARVLANEIPRRTAFMRGEDMDMEDSEASLLALIEEFPGEIAPKQSYAGFLEFFGRPQEALEQYDRALELDPLNPELHYRRGNMLSSISVRRDAEAEQAFRRSLEIEPDQSNVYVELAELYRNNGNLVGFIQNVDRAVELDPEDPEMPAAAVVVFQDINALEHAARYIDKAVAISAEGPTVRHLLARQSLLEGDKAAFYEQARRIIIDDIDDRNSAFVSTIREFINEMRKDGRLDEAVAFVTEHHPGFATPFAPGVPFKIILARGQSAFSLGHDADEAGRLAEATLMRAYAQNAGVELEVWHLPFLEVNILEGNEEAVIEFMLNREFQRFPMARPNAGSLQLMQSPLFNGVRANPEIAAGIATWERARVRAIKQLDDYFERTGVVIATPTP